MQEVPARRTCPLRPLPRPLLPPPLLLEPELAGPGRRGRPLLLAMGVAVAQAGGASGSATGYPPCCRGNVGRAWGTQ